MAAKGEELRALAEEAGISVVWIDAHQQRQVLETGALQHVLQSMGLPCATPTQAEESRQGLLAERKQSNLPPLLTAIAGQELVIDNQAGLHGAAYVLTPLDAAPATQVMEGRFDDTAAVRLLAPSSPGYYQLEVGRQRATIAVAPRKGFSIADACTASPDVAPRLWGLSAQLYSLRRPGDAGLGNFTALGELAETVAAQGGGALAASPMHAMFSGDSARISPYSPSSRLFFNALFIDPADVPGALPDSTNGQLEQRDMVDWPAAAQWRLGLLRKVFDRLTGGSPGLAAALREFAAFRHHGGEALHLHACFEALHVRFGGGWRDWAPKYRDPRGPAVAAFAAQHKDEVEFHAFLQWQAAAGLQKAHRRAAACMPVGLVADLAVGADQGGSHAWTRQAEMFEHLSIGAPPDLFNQLGQSWGVGAFSPLAMRRNGYAAFIEMLRANMQHSGGLRIDHILGLQRLWLVPHGVAPAEGAYLNYPLDDLLRLVALESWRHRAIVIGENLGTVPAGFNARLADAGILGMQVLWFEREGVTFTQPQNWSPHSVAMTTTHDLPTVTGWWWERDIGWKEKLGLFPESISAATEAVKRKGDRADLADALSRFRPQQLIKDVNSAPMEQIIEFVAATPAPLVLLPAEDLLGLAEQPNFPGSVDTHPNWQRRLPCAVAEMPCYKKAPAHLSALKAGRSRASPTNTSE